MAKTIVSDARLDEQVERYFAARPITMKDVTKYSITRATNDVTRMTIDITIDQVEFDNQEENGNG
jgi:hypothetical protein